MTNTRLRLHEKAKTGVQSGEGEGRRTGLLPPPEGDRIMEGLRVPPNLDTVPGVNFVITQEVGKLKPKDLKLAIDKNRAERELRAEEQRRIRAEGGGAGVLDLGGILAEERMNASDSGYYQRIISIRFFLLLLITI